MSDRRTVGKEERTNEKNINRFGRRAIETSRKRGIIKGKSGRPKSWSKWLRNGILEIPEVRLTGLYWRRSRWVDLQGTEIFQILLSEEGWKQP